MLVESVDYRGQFGPVVVGGGGNVSGVEVGGRSEGQGVEVAVEGDSRACCSRLVAVHSIAKIWLF
jgi:hypothetical protein